jgi:hypothetical protein
VREFCSPAAFRASVEQRLRAHARQLGIPAYIVRRQAALERLIARLMVVAPDHWALKGGLAIETRLGLRARASVDLDIDHPQGAEAAREEFARAVARDLDDHFSFTIREVRELRTDATSLALRYALACSVAGAAFEPIQVDVSAALPYRWEVERAQRPGLLAALGLGPIDVLLILLETPGGREGACVHPDLQRRTGQHAHTRLHRPCADPILRAH